MKTCIRSSVVFTLLALGSSISSVNGGWTEVQVGQGLNGILVDTGRNDGVSRVYSCVSNDSQNAREFSWNGIGWTSLTIGGDWNYATCVSLSCGALRSDGYKRLLQTNKTWYYEHADLNEFTCVAGTWNKSYSREEGSLPGNYIYGNQILPGRNDGISRLYLAGTGGVCREYSWNLATVQYVGLDLPSASSEIRSLAFGNGRNDGFSRIYGVTTGGELCEWSWNSGWTLNSTPLQLGPLNALSLGDCRSGSISLFIACEDGSCFEVVRNGNTWATTRMGIATQGMSAIVVGNGRADGKTGVFAGSKDTRIYEFYLNGNTWQQSLVKKGPGEVTGITIGPGRNDGIPRLYTTFANESVFEYTYTQTTSAPFAAQLLPGGILEWSSTPGGVYDVEWSSDLSTWRSDWTSLTGIPAAGAATQQPVPRFFRVKRRTE